MHNSPLWGSEDFAAPLPRGPGNGTSFPAEIFDIEVERLPDRPVVARVFGSIDLLTAQALRMCVDDHVDAGESLVLDLSRVDFLAASGLTVLTETDTRASRDNIAWALVANTRAVLRPLEVLGLRHALPTYDTVPEAITAVRAAAVSR